MHGASARSCAAILFDYHMLYNSCYTLLALVLVMLILYKSSYAHLPAAEQRAAPMADGEGERPPTNGGRLLIICLSLSLYIYIYIYICICIELFICRTIYLSIYLSLSLSLYIYIYIHICNTYAYIYIYTYVRREPNRAPPTPLRTLNRLISRFDM